MLARIAHFKRVLSSPLGLFGRRSLFIQTEPTPNEDALIFRPGKPVLPASGPKTIEFTSPSAALRKSRLAAELFAIEGVTSVLFASDFISVNKKPEALWINIKPSVFSAIMDHYTMHAGEPIIKDQSESASSDADSDSMAVKEGDSEVVKAIKELLETKVRPVIQGDGGDLSYEGFDESSGTVKLKLQGACRSCSSSVVTLKNGIENMLRFYIPEVKQVLQVHDETEEAAEAAFRAFEEHKHDKT